MDTHTVDLSRALTVVEAAFYPDPNTIRLFADAIHDHTHHPELCPTGTCRANVEAQRILAGAR